MNKRYLKSDEKNLILYIYEDERIIFTINCINKIHFYTSALVINKFLSGETKQLDNEILNPKT